MSQVPAGPDARTLLVADKSAAADGIVELTLTEPSGGRLPDWTPGAHIDLMFSGSLRVPGRSVLHG